MSLFKNILVLALLAPITVMAKSGGKNLECSHTYAICMSDAQHAEVNAKKGKDKAAGQKAEEQYKADEKMCKDKLKACEGH